MMNKKQKLSEPRKPFLTPVHSIQMQLLPSFMMMI